MLSVRRVEPKSMAEKEGSVCLEDKSTILGIVHLILCILSVIYDLGGKMKQK